MGKVESMLWDLYNLQDEYGKSVVIELAKAMNYESVAAEMTKRLLIPNE